MARYATIAVGEFGLTGTLILPMNSTPLSVVLSSFLHFHRIVLYLLVVVEEASFAVALLCGGNRY